MRRKLFFTVVGLTSAFIFIAGQTIKINHSKRAIICLTYDDGLQSHLTTVLSQLDSAGLKGTFFLNSVRGSSDVIGKAAPEIYGWTNAALHGHELANHTLFHSCSSKLGWQKEMAIESYTVDKLITEIRVENVILSLLDPGRKQRAFAFPCNNFLVNDTDYTTIIKNQGLVKYGRAGGDRNSFVSDFKKIDIMKIPSWMVEEGTTVKELIAFAETVKKTGGMGIYQFHGVGAEFFQVSKETHKAFLDYLKAHQDDFWVTTFSEAMNFVTEQY